MRGKQVILLSFAVVAIGLFVLPDTMSMFVGSHRWYSVRTASEQYKMCERCHIAEVGEWNANTGAHSAYSQLYAPNTGCFCHQINDTRLSLWINTSNVSVYGYEFFNESGSVNGSNSTSFQAGWRSKATPHAATTIYCVDCHINSTAQLNNPNEAHSAFFNATKLSGFNNSNTACMACHTMVGLNITMNRLYGGLIINATHGADYNWTVNVTINATSRTTNSTYWPPNQTSIP